MAKKQRKPKWPPRWATLPSRRILERLSRGEPVHQPARPSLAEILGPELAARLPSRLREPDPPPVEF